MNEHRYVRLRMILRRVESSEFIVTIRLGCNMPQGSVKSFWRKRLPCREEHYSSLASYWKTRLLKGGMSND